MVQLDVCDRRRHFATDVPRQATTYPVLLAAILAVSSKHLSLIGDYDTELSAKYYSRCLELLTPALSHEDLMSTNDSTIAATVILRLFEEFESKTAQSSRTM